MSIDDLPSFSVEVEYVDDAAVVIVSGDVDNSSTAMFKSKLDEVMKLATRVVIDLRRVTFMDESGVRLIVAARNRCGGGAFSIRGIAGPSQRKLQLMGVLNMLEVEPDSTDS